MNLKITNNDALLIVDVQNDFCPNGALAVPDGDAIVPVINRLIPKFEHIILTQDWHPKGHISFAEEHNLPAFNTIQLDYGEQILWPTHCVQGTHGSEFHPDLDTAAARLIIKKGYRKHIDSYSAFVEADRRTMTGLAGFLRECGVGRVFIAGLATDFCVTWTAMDACQLGFESMVIDDACRGIDTNGSLAHAWEAMLNQGVRKIHSRELD